MHVEEHAVVIAGGGPTGLMLAAELALAKVDVVVIERRPNQDLAGSRAGGLHARTLELLDQRGVVERFLAAGQKAQVISFAYSPLDLSDFPTRHPYGLALFQNHIERLLAEWVSELPVTFHRSTEVTGFTQDASGVTVTLSSGKTLRAKYLVGCDGARSLVRKQAGIEFPGWDASVTNLIAEAKFTTEPPRTIRTDAKGVIAIGLIDEGQRFRAVLREETVNDGDAPTVEELKSALHQHFGTDFGVHDVRWLSRFSDMTRQAAAYRKDRVLLAGDAAHVHSPVGGQGLNLGVHDAVNLGWKLALVVSGAAPDALLDSYHQERHPVTRRILRNTMGQTALSKVDDRVDALKEQLGELMKFDQARRWYAGMMSGLDVRYELGDGHPLVGRRMPDLELETADGPRRVFSYLRSGKPVLINLGGGDAPSHPRVQLVRATYGGTWELPVIGVVSAPRTVLVRPDGYVAWVGETSSEGFDGAAQKWFGP